MERLAGLCADTLFAAKRTILGRHRVRRARVYCVGTGKSGTHSIIKMFSKTVRARHEPEPVPLMEKILAWRRAEMSEQEFSEWFRCRDRELALEVDASPLNFELLDFLVREFPDARFILTIRDCYSCCNSLMNHILRFKGKIHPLWFQMPRLKMDRPVHAPEEQLLKDKGVFTLDSYFSYWTRHNQDVLDKIPAERLLVVRTDQIKQKAAEIADFCGLPRRAIRLNRTHEFQNPDKQQLLRQIDSVFVEAKVEKHCRPLMSRFFPEIRSLSDAKL